MTKKRKNLYIGWGIYFIIVIGFVSSVLVQPIWDKLNPHIIGLPFSIFVVVACQFLICIGLCAMFIMDRNLQDKEEKQREAGEEIEY